MFVSSFLTTRKDLLLFGSLVSEIYMTTIPGVGLCDPSSVCKFNESLYGLKYASRLWYQLKSTSYTKGYTVSENDSSLFNKKPGHWCFI